MPRLAFDLLDQQLLGFVAGESGDPLELVLLLRHELLVLRGGGRRARFAFAQPALAADELLLEPLDRRLSLGGRGVASDQRLLEGRGLLPILPRLPLGLHQDLVRFFLRVEQRLFPARLGVALRVFGQSQGVFLGAADRVSGDPLAAGDPDREYTARHDGGDDGGEDGVREPWQHA